MQPGRPRAGGGGALQLLGRAGGAGAGTGRRRGRGRGRLHRASLGFRAGLPGRPAAPGGAGRAGGRGSSRPLLPGRAPPAGLALRGGRGRSPGGMRAAGPRSHRRGSPGCAGLGWQRGRPTRVLLPGGPLLSVPDTSPLPLGKPGDGEGCLPAGRTLGVPGGIWSCWPQRAAVGYDPEQEGG